MVILRCKTYVCTTNRTDRRRGTCIVYDRTGDRRWPPAVTTRLGIIDLCSYKGMCRHYPWENGVKGMTAVKQCGDLGVRSILLFRH